MFTLSAKAAYGLTAVLELAQRHNESPIQIKDVAEAHDIPHQLVVRGTGGTDGRQIQLFGSGVPCAVISLACRYVHSAAGLISEEDFVNTVELLYSFLKEFDAKRLESVTSFR